MKNKLKALRTLSLKSAISTAAVTGSSAVFAEGETPIELMFAEINIATVSAAVLALGILIIGVKMAEKGIAIAKRNISKI